MFTNEQLFALQPRTKVVEVPEMGDGESVVMTEIADAEAQARTTDLYVEGPAGQPIENPDGFYQARWIAASCRDKDGKLRFTLDDLAKIAAIPQTLRLRLFNAAFQVNTAGVDALKNS